MGLRYFYGQVLPKSPMGDSKISALPSQSRAQQRHHTRLALRKLPCLRGNGGKEDPPQGDPELQWVFKSLWKSAFLIAEDMVCHKHADSTRSINFDCNRKIRQVKWKWKGKKLLSLAFPHSWLFVLWCIVCYDLSLRTSTSSTKPFVMVESTMVIVFLFHCHLSFIKRC